MALIRLTACLLISAAFTEASKSSLLQRSATRQRSFAGLKYSPQDPAARTLLTLDTNQDGKIDPNEVAAFAKAQGLDTAAATQEFSNIDLNGDGTLDSNELQKVLAPTADAAAAQTLTQVQPPKVEPPVVASSQVALQPAVEPPLVASSPLAPQPAGATSPAELVSTGSAAAEKVEIISDESRNSMRKAAQSVADELAVEEKEENKAREFDRKAAEIHANSEALVKKTTQDALDAGAKASHAKADELMAQISKLEEQAEKAEVRAAALRAKAKMELEQGNQLMAEANRALQGKSL